jgi:hypothetical protein
MKMKKLLLLAVLALPIPAIAADLPVKAPVAPSLYSFNGSGLFVGAYTEYGGSPVTAQVPGVAQASLTSTSAAIGATVGYAYRFSNGLLGTVEADICAKNFNGANAGFSLTGPICLEQRAMVFAPTAQILNLFSFLSIPNVFSNLTNIAIPPNAVVTNSYLGFGAGAYWNDMTVAFHGVGSNKVWSVNPELVLMKMDLVTIGTTRAMLRSFGKVDLESQTVLFGANQSSAKTGVGGRLGLAFDF